MSNARWLVVALAVCMLAACGGGSTPPAMYSIGGTVSGLMASGLVLADSGSALTVPANATSFMFSTSVASGSAYAVSVQAQPTDETCAISDGSGAVSGNVTGVVVQCVPDTYTIGGSLSGLTGSGLVLLDNGGDTLTVTAGATGFAFSSPVNSGASYAVTVQTQPRGEICSVSEGSGNATSNVTSVAVSCAAVSYTIGGSINGLSGGSAIVLLDNGGNALTVPTGSSAFTFSAPLPGGSNYSVSVQTQPSGETCAVSGGNGIASSNITSVSITCQSGFATGAANVVALTIDPGPADASHQTFNMPFVTVIICQPGGASCATIPDVLVDTGSSGLRVMASVLAANGVTLPAIEDPGVPANSIQECLPFADGYAWGQVSEANVSIGGETTSASVPIQVINDAASPAPQAPPDCTSQGSSLNGVNDIDANGVLGVSTFDQDCGSACQSVAGNNVYWSCDSSGTCTSTTLALADQVANPVASFPTDNNGVIVQLPSIPAGAAATASGYLVFGVATQSNNSLGAATVLTTDSAGHFTTSYNGQPLASSFIDSGSNALFFNDATLKNFECFADQFYCPTATTSLSATDQGANSASSPVSFQVTDLMNVDPSSFAIAGAAGPAPSIANFGPYFDWGVPFFYGRTVFVAIEGMNAAGTTGPYYAY